MVSANLAVKPMEAVTRPAPKKERPVLFTLLAFLMFCGGLSLPLIGLALIILHSFIPADSILSGAGTIVMILSIPMLFCGSHMIDVMDNRRPHNGK